MTDLPQQGSSLPSPTFVNDHIAIRVADIDRSTLFYKEAFGAEILTNPFIIEGVLAEAMFGGLKGVRFKLRQLSFSRGVIELFQFIEPILAEVPWNAATSGILHMGFQVQDVEATALRVEQAGGRLLHLVTPWGESKLVFCSDPDGNIIEMSDSSIKELITATIDAFPEAKPNV